MLIKKIINNFFKKKYTFNIITLIIEKLKLFILKLNIFKNKINLIFFYFFIKKILTKNYKLNYNIKNNNYFNILYKNILFKIFKINILKSNIFINLTNIKGKSLFILNSGLLKFKGSNKIKKLAANVLIKKLYFKAYPLEKNNYILQFKGLKINKKFIYYKLKFFFIAFKLLFNNNLKPFNGCKPKKLKRKKHNKFF